MAHTDASKPMKPFPSYYYHYLPAPSSRSIHRSFISVPNLRAVSSSSQPPAARSSPLSVSPKSHYHPHEIPRSRTPLPAHDSRRLGKREDERTFSTHNQQNVDARQRRSRLIAERDATLKRMEERQRQAEGKSWYKEAQRFAAEAIRKQKEEQRRRVEEDYRRVEEDYRRVEEKLLQMAQAQDEEERKKLARMQKQEREDKRGCPQTRYRAADASDKSGYRERSCDGRYKNERESEQEQPPEREHTKGDTHKRVNKNRTRRSKSLSSVVPAWEAYKEGCTEIMRAKPPKGKPSGRVTFYDIPWPILGQAGSFHDLTNENISAFLLSPHHSQDKSPQARLRAAILIWHPDKFVQKVLPHIAESHRPAVSAGVEIVARIVTELIFSQSD